MEQERNEGNTNLQRKNLPPPPVSEDRPRRNCPRCNSSNTKFCYYNNYSLSQPRHFCRACRRYWTHGGTLRNIPIGGGCRINRRQSRNQPPTTVQAGETLRPLMAAMAQQELMTNTFCGDCTILPHFAAMEPASQFGVNLSLLQGMSLQTLKSPVPTNQFQSPGNVFSAQKNLMNQPIRHWAQNFHMSGSCSPGVGPSFMDQAGPSFSALNQGPGDNHPGCYPSRQ